MSFWILLFSIITSNMGKNIGLPYLFLDPEYLHEVTFKSMLIMGISYGVFTISFFITSYIIDSHRFAFLGTIKYPFVKYCLNNSIIPFLFFITYLYKFIQFQKQFGFENDGDIFIEALAFILGASVTILIIFAYFRRTNRDVFPDIAQNLDSTLRKKKINTVQVIKKLKDAKKKRYTILSYLELNGRIRRVDQEYKYDKLRLLKIIDQHHLNAVSVEIFVFVTIMVIGIFRDREIFQIPAAASGLLFSSFIIMFTGAFSYWLRGWAITGVITLLVVLNILVKKEIIHSHYEAFGLNYETEKAKYSKATIKELNSEKNFKKDKESTIQILNNWRAKFPEDKKPKMIFLCFSGGGQRSAMWTTNTLRFVDSTLNGELMNHTMLITGASGGLVGASYYREIYLRYLENKIPTPHDPKYTDNIGKDILNPMIFSLVVSDIFLRFQKFKFNDHSYYKGRGYAFEEQLNSNTESFLNKRLIDYQKPEQEGKIPMLIMSPSIINDGRKLHISAQHVSYMSRPEHTSDSLYKPRFKGIDFMRLFEKQEAKNVRFLSALRMSATFPYITPNVHLPSEPTMEIMDAGLSDNFGITDAVRFMYTFKDWIAENTGGVVIVSIRDTEKDREVKQFVKKSIWNKMFNPIGGLLNNWDAIQDFKNESNIEYGSSWFNSSLDFVSFEYIPQPKDWDLLKEKHLNLESLEEKKEQERASLSWHLTTREKHSIKRTIYEKNNQKALNTLRNLLNN